MLYVGKALQDLKLYLKKKKERICFTKQISAETSVILLFCRLTLIAFHGIYCGLN